MKGKFFLFLFTFFSIAANAQKKMLLKQIAALQIYIGYAQKGYSIAKKGLNLVGDIKKEEFNLHSDYLNSLKKITPEITSYGKIAAITAMQLKIINVYKNASRQLKTSSAFNSDEINFMNEVFNRLIDDCAGTIEELITVTTDSKLEMKDDERLKRIDALYNDMQAQYSFVQSFAGEANVLAASRLREQDDIKNSRIFYGNKIQ